MIVQCSNTVLIDYANKEENLWQIIIVSTVDRSIPQSQV